jgi:hypothetical protein
MGEAANLENQRNMAQRNIDEARKAQMMNMGGNLAGMAVAGGPKVYSWLSKALPGVSTFTGADLAGSAAASGSGALGGSLAGGSEMAAALGNATGTLGAMGGATAGATGAAGALATMGGEALAGAAPELAAAALPTAAEAAGMSLAEFLPVLFGLF